MNLFSEVRLVIGEAVIGAGDRLKQFWERRVAFATHQKSERHISNTSFETEDVFRDAQFIEWLDWGNLKVKLTDQIHADCRKYGISPPDADQYEELSGSGKQYLNDESMRALQSSIRSAKKERSQELRAWGVLIIGLIGALTGLVATLV